MGGLTKGLANIIPILLSTAGSRCNITDTKQRDLLTNISTNQILTNRVCVTTCLSFSYHRFFSFFFCSFFALFFSVCFCFFFFKFLPPSNFYGFLQNGGKIYRVNSCIFLFFFRLGFSHLFSCSCFSFL